MIVLFIDVFQFFLKNNYEQTICVFCGKHIFMILILQQDLLRPFAFMWDLLFKLILNKVFCMNIVYILLLYHCLYYILYFPIRAKGKKIIIFKETERKKEIYKEKKKERKYFCTCPHIIYASSL